MNTKYRCFFMIMGIARHTQGLSIGDFKDGFWVTAQWEFTKASDNVMWIAPAAIEYIAKEASDE